MLLASRLPGAGSSTATELMDGALNLERRIEVNRKISCHFSALFASAFQVILKSKKLS
jgi:hypothetical protein